MTLAVQECLSLMVAAYRGVEGQPALIVEALMLENVHSVSHVVCHVTSEGLHHNDVMLNFWWHARESFSPPHTAQLTGEASSCPVCVVRLPILPCALKICLHVSLWRQVGVSMATSITI